MFHQGQCGCGPHHHETMYVCSTFCVSHAGQVDIHAEAEVPIQASALAALATAPCDLKPNSYLGMT